MDITPSLSSEELSSQGGLLDLENKKHLISYFLLWVGPSLLSPLFCNWYFGVSVHRQQTPAAYSRAGMGCGGRGGGEGASTSYLNLTLIVIN